MMTLLPLPAGVLINLSARGFRTAAPASIRTSCRRRTPIASTFSPTSPSVPRRRSFHTSLPRYLAPSPPSPPATAFALLPSRRLVSVSGPDAPKFLQGAITRNIYDVPVGSTSLVGPLRKEGVYTAFLSAQGRVLHDVFVYPDVAGIGTGRGAVSVQVRRSGGSEEVEEEEAVGAENGRTIGSNSSVGSKQVPNEGESFLIEVDANEAEKLARHINKYKLRAKFDVRVLGADEAKVWHSWGAARPLPPDDTVISLLDPRCPGLGTRYIVPGSFSSSVPAFLADSLPQTDEAAYTIHRYLHGVAEGQAELAHNSALPLESNLDLMHAIDFRKGCYVGQELTIRTRHRGVVRKRVLPVVMYDPHLGEPRELRYRQDAGLTGAPSGLTAEVIPTDTSIGRVGKKGRSVGKWLNGVGNLGLALCRLEAMTDLIVPGAGPVAEGAAVKEGAEKSNGEFFMDLGSEMEGPRMVKVKAFVPEWLRKGLKEQLEGGH